VIPVWRIISKPGPLPVVNIVPWAFVVNDPGTLMAAILT
jgi:hypothetical protein